MPTNSCKKHIGDFNLIKMNLDNEPSKEDKDEEKLKAINSDLRRVYADIMANEYAGFRHRKKSLIRLFRQFTRCLLNAPAAKIPKPRNLKPLAAAIAQAAAAATEQTAFNKTFNQF